MEIVSCFNRKGKSVDKGTLVNGNGTVKYYDDTGKFKKKLAYENGELKEKE